MIKRVSDILIKFGWHNEYIDHAFNFIICSQVDSKLEQTKGNYSNPVLKQLQKYLHSVVIEWMKEVLHVDPKETTTTKETKEQMQGKIEPSAEYYLWSSFATLRTAEMFDIFSDFPDSSPCLNDLKYALDKTSLHNLLAN